MNGGRVIPEGYWRAEPASYYEWSISQYWPSYTVGPYVAGNVKFYGYYKYTDWDTMGGGKGYYKVTRYSSYTKYGTYTYYYYVGYWTGTGYDILGYTASSTKYYSYSAYYSYYEYAQYTKAYYKYYFTDYSSYRSSYYKSYVAGLVLWILSVFIYPILSCQQYL